MRRFGILLALILLLCSSVPAWADMANCDGPTTPEESERRVMLESADPIGTNPIYAGLVGILNACEAVKRKFNAALASLGATLGSSPMDSKVQNALRSVSGKSSGMESCLRSFNADACKNYLDIAGVDPVQPATSSTATGNAPAATKPMSFSDALAARRRVIDADTKAHTEVGANGTACRAGAGECRSMLESTVDPVIREADELNANTEYRAQLPAYSLVSVDFANRMGWMRQSGQWVFESNQTTGSRTTLGNYLLSMEECGKLHDRLEQEVKANPAKEPTELTFFEAECVPQAPNYHAAVLAWRSTLNVLGASQNHDKADIADASQEEAKPDVSALGQWQAGLIRAEAEEDAAALVTRISRQAAEPPHSLAVGSLSMAPDAGRALAPSMPPAETDFSKERSNYSSICTRNGAQLENAVRASGFKRYSRGTIELEIQEMAKRTMQPCASYDAKAQEYYEATESARVRQEKKCAEYKEAANDPGVPGPFGMMKSTRASVSESMYKTYCVDRFAEGDEGEETKKWFGVYSAEFSKMASNWEGYSRSLDPVPSAEAIKRQSAHTAQCAGSLRKPEFVQLFSRFRDPGASKNYADALTKLEIPNEALAAYGGDSVGALRAELARYESNIESVADSYCKLESGCASASALLQSWPQSLSAQTVVQAPRGALEALGATYLTLIMGAEVNKRLLDYAACQK